MGAQSALDNLSEFFAMQWVDVLAALLTPLIALLAVAIAYQQWRLNRANLRERLFDRRFELFKASQAFLSEILAKATFDDEALWRFTDACQRSRFLFGKNTQTYLFEIRSRALDMRMCQVKLKDVPVGDKRTKLVDEEHEHLIWLTDQLNVLPDHFEPFLGFDVKQ